MIYNKERTAFALSDTILLTAQYVNSVSFTLYITYSSIEL